MKKILLVHNTLSTFVRKDIDILSRNADVKVFHFPVSSSILHILLYQVKLKLWLLRNLHGASGILVWFCDYHTLLPALFARLKGIRCAIIVGGYDAVSIPSIRFGIFHPSANRFRRLFATWSYRLANAIFPVDESLVEGVNTYAEENQPTGVRYFVPKSKALMKAIPTGYDPEIWKRNPDIGREPMVLTVGIASKMRPFRRKGFDLLIEAANLLPETRFVIIGLQKEMIDYARKRNTANNLEIHSFVPNRELPDYYSRAKVFCQLSLSEGLPNTLCEAMLCECVPVGSNVNGIPKAIGDTGIVLAKPDPEAAAQAIKDALNSSEEQGRMARSRIMEIFSEAKREKELCAYFDE